MLHPARIQCLCEHPPRGNKKYVLYWMQQSQRTHFNHALEYAVIQANQFKLPLVVCFGLMDDYPDANARHYYFMLQGLADVAANLRKRGILFVLRHGNPPDVAAHYAAGAALVVTDRGYLRHQKKWRQALAAACDAARMPVFQIESDAVVPVEVASNKREFAARTLRPKIRRHLGEFLQPLKPARLRRSSLGLQISGNLDPTETDAVFSRLKVDRSVSPVPQHFKGGENIARKQLSAFIKNHLSTYAVDRNEPAANATSHLSPYLHFGQISPLEIALKMKSAAQDAEVFLEELIVRRELSFNYCEYTEQYDSYDALPAWARQTLKDHAGDNRTHLYTQERLESARTADVYWNAAQREMIATGFMHNYMWMYWGKKILEWSQLPREGFETTLKLNNKFFLDGRDPNSYAAVAWIYGLHDRPWGPARKIFGTVRYMNAAGLKRKFDMDAYVKRIDALDP